MTMKSKLKFTAYISTSNPHPWTVNKYGICFSVRPENISPNLYEFKIHDVKGDFEITKITYGSQQPQYDKDKRSFILELSDWTFQSFSFTICVNLEYKVIDYDSKLININHSLWIPSDLLKALGLYQCIEKSFSLHGYEFLVFKYWIKKFDDTYIEVHVDNPSNVEICGKTDDFIFVLNNLESKTINLSFAFDPMKFQEESITQDPKSDGSRPVSTLPISQNMKSSWHEIMSNTKYFDVILISSSRYGIKTHRCILDKFSTHFSKIIAESDGQKLPIKINVREFDAEIIEASIDFLYDKIDSINGKEVDVFKFASAYGIEILKDACCAHFEKSVNAENVCEYIQIAYENEFEDLKQKCKEFIVLNKKEIDSSKLKELPKNIIVDIFCI